MTQTIDRQFMLFNTEILRIDCLFKGHIMQFCIEALQREQMSCRSGWDCGEHHTYSSRVSSCWACNAGSKGTTVLQYLSRQAEKTVGGMGVMLLPVV